MQGSLESEKKRNREFDRLGVGWYSPEILTLEKLSQGTQDHASLGSMSPQQHGHLQTQNDRKTEETFGGIYRPNCEPYFSLAHWGRKKHCLGCFKHDWQGPLASETCES